MRRKINWFIPDYESKYWIDYMQSDPDFVKADGYETPFLANFKKDGSVDILVEEDSDVCDLLQRWVNNEGYSGRDVQSWDAYNIADNAVAYRGGSGYLYTITIFDEL